MFRRWDVFTSEIYISVGCLFWSLHLRWKACFVQHHLNLPVRRDMHHLLRDPEVSSLVDSTLGVDVRSLPVQFFATPWTAAHQAPLSMGFSRQGYGSGLPCPPPGCLPHPGVKPASPELQEDSTQKLPGKSLILLQLLSFSNLKKYFPL